MKPIKVLIVDDEAPARRKLGLLLQAEADVEIAGEAADGHAAVAAIRELCPDLVFLDIRMPGLDGFEVIRQVGAAAMPPVVFVTAYDDRAVEAFEVQALDYVLKPVSPSRCRAVMERVRASRQTTGAAELTARLEALLDRTAERPRWLERIMVWRAERAVLLPVEKIDRIEAARNYVEIFAGGASFVVRHPIGELAERLDPARFLRISRSHIVRLDAVKELHSWFHGDMKVILRDGTELMWSRRYRARQRPEMTLE